MDTDQNLAILIDLFPYSSVEEILNEFLNCDADLNQTIAVLLNKIESNLDDNSFENESLGEDLFSHLVKRFPNVEIEAIEAFLATIDVSSSEMDEEQRNLIVKEFMKQCSATSATTNNRSNLKMKLSDFNALLKTSRELELAQRQANRPQNLCSTSPSSTTFSFTFLESADDFEFNSLNGQSGSSVRAMAFELQQNRIEEFQRASKSFSKKNLTGTSAATYYSQLGQGLTLKIDRLNRIAAEKIYHERNNILDASQLTVLDLHYLTVAEARLIVSEYLVFHEKSGSRSVKIITGKGNHSLNDTCKLTSSILNLLQARKGIIFTIMSVSIAELFHRLFNQFVEDKLNKDDFKECAQLELSVRSAGFFSLNETSIDLNPRHIKFLLTDFITASCFETIQIDRLEHLRMAQNYFLEFLGKCIRYDLIEPKSSIEYMETIRYFVADRDSDDVKEERFVSWLKAVPRDVKIDRMKRIIEYRRICKNSPEFDTTMFRSDDDTEENEDSDSDYWKKWLNCCVLVCLDHCGLLIREIELLERGNDDDVTEAVADSKLSGNSSTTKIEKPFKLVRDRKSVGSDVFKYGHNLPTMTIDEYLALERQRGNIISGGGAASAIRKGFDEDDEKYIEAELIKAREFDEFKDMHRKGSGNTYNRS